MQTRVLATKAGKTYAAITIEGAPTSDPSLPNVMFPCLIWDHEGRSSDADRTAVAKALLDAGCRYVVCGGSDPERWHDAADSEYLDRKEGGAVGLVMTSWHEGESPEEVAFFFVKCTNFDEHDFTEYVVLHVGTSHLKQQVDVAVRNHALGE